VTQSALEVVHRAFAGQRTARRSSGRQSAPRDGIEEDLFATFTAFTHPRRLQILRRLDAYGETAPDVLSEALSMSPAAVARHLDKLSRRGLVTKRLCEGRACCAVAEGMPPVAAQLLAAVLADMGGAGR
jgi:DNA-binding transcriptional ArsR family regulator